jgi:CRP-like cAMP-binding protein
MAPPLSGNGSGSSADLASCALFKDLAEPQWIQLLDNHRLIRMAAGQPLLHEQDDGQVLYLFRAGIAKVRSIDVEGQEVVLSLLGPGEVCGEMAILHSGRRTADVVCLTNCELLVLRAASFRAVLHSDPRLAIALARLESQRLQRLNRRLLRRESRATVRLLEVLADLASRSAPGAPATAPIPALPQRELAAISGLARETASRTLTRLRRLGMVESLDAGQLRLVVPAGKDLENLAAWVAADPGA